MEIKQQIYSETYSYYSRSKTYFHKPNDVLLKIRLFRETCAETKEVLMRENKKVISQVTSCSFASLKDYLSSLF